MKNLGSFKSILRKCVLFAVFTVFFTAVYCEEVKPKLVFTLRDPDLMILGSESPYFALYENGVLIYYDKNDKVNKSYRSAKMSEKEMKEFEVDEETYKLNDSYEISKTNDEQNCYFLLFKDGVMKKINVYGKIDKGSEDRAKVPPKLLKLYDNINEYKNDKSEKWLPEKVELLLWPWNESKESVDWPKKWPDLSGKDVKKRKKGPTSLYLEKKLYPDLTEYSKKLYRKAVTINGKKMVLSLRFPFPSENLWLKDPDVIELQ